MTFTRTLKPQTISFYDLPLEIISHIIPEIALHRDLIAFACTSKLSSHLIIPQHTEYRTLSIGFEECDHIWKHLALHPELTCNFREVTLEGNYHRNLHLPSTLVVTQPTEDEDQRDYEQEQRDLITSIGYMSRLTQFVWHYHSFWTLGLPDFGALLFETLERLPSLQDVQLDITKDFNPGILLEELKLWKMSRLRSLELKGGLWHSHLIPSQSLTTWLQSLSSISSLSLPFQVIESHTENLFFPNLKNFSISTVHSPPFAVPVIIAFLERHPSLEGLSWSAIEAFTITPSPNFLPNLKKLSCIYNIFSGIMSSTRWPARKLEFLELNWRNNDINLLEALCNSSYLNPYTLRKLGLTHDWNANNLYTLAQTFPRIEVLSLHWLTRGGKKWHDFESLADSLSNFKRLQVLKDNELWVDIVPSDGPVVIDDKLQALVDDRVGKLAHRCPNLRVVTHPRTWDYRILITRENGEILLEDGKRGPLRPFDWFGGDW
ncbi:hypothetical protein BDN72DRAFT_844153 [Pluteus cervinus]|uniref:Uncharacterized protein n=1 Tax=Pluteus cervinus TaxID=181527 RepID=A0ACD3ALS9_9AGAR|nr:hypothetical protein BDN72DRAFT_844153 [Pluteus cervinus]